MINLWNNQSRKLLIKKAVVRYALICVLLISVVHSGPDADLVLEKPGTSLELPNIPHVRVNAEEGYIDVDGTFCLEEGMLELAVCTEGTKEHEAVIAVKAKARDIHLMLTLLGAQPGHPAYREPLDDTHSFWKKFPATGHAVDVSVVYQQGDSGLEERPMCDFIVDERGEGFTDQPFLFAGSHVAPSPIEGQPPQYLADVSGNVVSISTFGDEVLSLREFSSHANRELIWQINTKAIPPQDTPATLRLRPRFEQKKLSAENPSES